MQQPVIGRVTSAELGASVALVTVEGELDAYSAPELEERLAALPSDARFLVVDLTQLTILDSAGLGLLTSAARRLRSRDGAVVLATEDPNVLRILSLTGLGRLFVVRATAGDAAQEALGRALLAAASRDGG